MSGISAICIDETSFKRGQSYITVVSDAKARRVIYVDVRRGAENVEASHDTGSAHDASASTKTASAKQGVSENRADVSNGTDPGYHVSLREL